MDIDGKFSSARATRTFSRAAPKLIPHFQFSQWAQLFTPHPAQPRRRSNSPSSARNRPFAALRWPANVVISLARSGVETEEKSVSMGFSG